MSGIVSVFTLVLVAGFISLTVAFPNPIHASCNIDWNFGVTCDTVSAAILKQIDTWKTDANCPDGAGEKCLYKLMSKTATQIKATHQTPVKHYVDDLTFTLSPTGGSCKVHGYSTSETWYAVLDYGTNYCNLHNLITGSKLDKTASYKEVTSDSVCTQFSSHDCDKY